MSTEVARAIAAIKESSPRIRKLLGDRIFDPDCDRGGDLAYINSGNCYEWYYAIGAHYRPKFICEIGVRYGYSLAALAAGSSRIEAPDWEGARRLLGFDLQSYEDGSNAVAYRALAKLCQSVTIERANTQEMAVLPIDPKLAEFWLCHIDGDHSFHGKMHDLMLAWPVSKVIVVDDYDFLAEVRRATDHFLAGIDPKRFAAHYLPSYRGTLVIERQ